MFPSKGYGNIIFTEGLEGKDVLSVIELMKKYADARMKKFFCGEEPEDPSVVKVMKKVEKIVNILDPPQKNNRGKNFYLKVKKIIEINAIHDNSYNYPLKYTIKTCKKTILILITI